MISTKKTNNCKILKKEHFLWPYFVHFGEFITKNHLWPVICYCGKKFTKPSKNFFPNA